MTVLLDTNDLGEAEAVLSASFSKMRLTAPRRRVPAPMRLERLFAGSMGVDSANYGVSFDFSMDPPDHILLCRVISGGVEQRSPGAGTARFAPGDVGVIGVVGGGSVNGCVQRGQIDHLIVEPRLLSECAGEVPGSKGPVRLTGCTPVSPAAGKLLSHTIDQAKLIASQPHSLNDHLLVATLERHVAAVLLATLPSNAVLEPTIEDRHDSTPVLLRRAIDFIDDNCHRDISLTDIAEAVYVTPRALQYMFRKHRECTPMEYLRSARLYHAHLDLVAGDRMTTTVGQVAARWGFGHLGRFAVYYRRHYGQSPHAILRA